MRIERGRLGPLPFAATGAGPPLIVLAGLSPVAGAVSDGYFRSIVAPVRALARTRRLIVLNRWKGLRDGISMREIAERHAEAAAELGSDRAPDLVGVSTGGSIAQQWAADHPAALRRLALISSACRLGPAGRAAQARVAALLRAGATRAAVAAMADAVAPGWAGPLARAAGWTAGPLVIRPAAAADLIATIEAEDGFDLAACAGPIRVPTLIVAGRRDRIYGPDLFAQTARLIPGSTLLMLPDRGHLGAAGDRRAIAALAGFLGT